MQPQMFLRSVREQPPPLLPGRITELSRQTKHPITRLFSRLISFTVAVKPIATKSRNMPCIQTE